MPLLNCIMLLASHLVGMETPRAAGPMAGASTVCTVQPNRANANASEHAAKSLPHHRHPGLACDETRKLPFIVAYGSDPSPIGNRPAPRPVRLIWSHLVIEGVCVTQLTAGKTRGLAQPRTRNDPVALDS